MSKFLFRCCSVFLAFDTTNWWPKWILSWKWQHKFQTKIKAKLLLFCVYLHLIACWMHHQRLGCYQRPHVWCNWSDTHWHRWCRHYRYRSFWSWSQWMLSWPRRLWLSDETTAPTHEWMHVREKERERKRARAKMRKRSVMHRLLLNFNSCWIGLSPIFVCALAIVALILVLELAWFQRFRLMQSQWFAIKIS